MSEHRVAVAYSGGRDSTALLHATASAAMGQGIRVIALHVHHGLSDHADAWLAHCESQCRRWRRAGKPIDFLAQRLSGAPLPGDSVEAWARQARYKALGEMARGAGSEVVLLAHHQRDQAETFLLQALRGAGSKGLSAMPRSVERDGIRWARPWLDKSRAEVDAYVRRHRLNHIEDDSNTDPRFDRNRLRLRVWPLLIAAFPQADTSFARAANWAQQASALMEEVGHDDLARVVEGDCLDLAAWSALSAARRGNTLRVWIKARSRSAPSASTVARLLDELPARRQGRWPLGVGELRLHRGKLRWHGGSDLPSFESERETSLAIRGPGIQALPGWHGELRVRAVASGGVPLAWLAHAVLQPRRGGERFQAGPGRPPRSLKKQFQDVNLAAWERAGPLVYSGGQLVFVPGLGLDARVIGLPGQAQVDLEWRPTDAS